jgi:hypothetical protein
MGKITAEDAVTLTGLIGAMVTGLILVSNGIFQIVDGDAANARTAHSGDGMRHGGEHGIAQGGAMATAAIVGLIFKVKAINARVDAPDLTAIATKLDELKGALERMETKLESAKSE